MRERTNFIKDSKSLLAKIKDLLRTLRALLYRAEHLLITLIRGKLFFLLGRFVRTNGSLSAMIVIVLFVTATNLSAKYDENELVGYWSKEGNKKETVLAANKTEGSLGIDGTDEATQQLALGADVETRKQAPQINSKNANTDDFVIDSAELFVIGIEDGELTDKVEIYTVKDGDTLGKIAREKNVSVNTLLWANDIADVDDINPGDTLFILPVSGVKHKVRASDTIETIAKKYKAQEAEILAFNDLPANGELKSGQEIIIPNGEIEPPPKPAPTTVAKESSSFLPIRAEISTQTKGRYAHPLPGSRRTQGIHPTNAVDLAAPMGSKIYAADKGKVTKVLGSGWGGGYGKHVVITHNDGTITLYAHLSSIGVKKGQKVKKGQAIGRVGSTGRSTGPHLHFEIRGDIRNPF